MCGIPHEVMFYYTCNKHVNCSWTIEATWKVLDFSHHVTTKTEQALPCAICHLKGIQCKLWSRNFFNLSWLMPCVRLMLKIHKGWYAWFITADHITEIMACFTTNYYKNNYHSFSDSSNTHSAFQRLFLETNVCFYPIKKMNKLIKAASASVS